MSVSFNPSQLTKGARASFMEAAADAGNPMLIEKGVCTLVPSDSADEDFSWIGDGRSFQEFVDEVEFAPLSDGTYNLENKKYAQGLAVKKDDIMDGKVRGLPLRIAEMAQKWPGYVDYLITTAMIAGTSAGAGTIAAGNHFATGHAARGDEGGTQDNLKTGTGTSVAQFQTDVGTALAAILGYKREDGLLLNMGASRFFVMVPIPILFKMREAINAAVISQTSNVRFEQLQIDVFGNGYLSDANDYYVGIADSPIAGFVYQDREQNAFTAQDNAESDSVFERDEYRYRSSFRGRAGFGRWSKVVKVTNT
jgi:phage major head subunit gpT-like protein